MRCILFLLAGGALLLRAESSVERLDSAARVMREVMEISEKSIPQDLLDKAQCVVVVPGMKRGAFIFGAKYGRGFLSCRREGPGWSAPASVRIEGGSFGFQIGGAETDLVMLILNERGMDKLLSSKFTLGGDATAAAGPVGRSSTAQTDAYLRAEILTYSRARGVFAGVSLSGATLRPDIKANRDLYGQELANRDIVTGKVESPKQAAEFISVLNKYSSRKVG